MLAVCAVPVLLTACGGGGAGCGAGGGADATADSYSRRVRSTIAATLSTARTPATECPALRMPVQRLAPALPPLP